MTQMNKVSTNDPFNAIKLKEVNKYMGYGEQLENILPSGEHLKYNLIPPPPILKYFLLQTCIC